MMIQPGLVGIEREDEWQENEETPFGVSPDVRWFVEYQVGIKDKNKKRGVFKKKEAILYLGYTSITVCSPAFKKAPPEDYGNVKVSRALVQDNLDELALEQFLRSRLTEISASSEGDLKDRLASFLVIDGQ